MTRIALAVYLDLATIPGVMYSVDSAMNLIRGTLDKHYGYYRPMVSLVSSDTSKVRSQSSDFGRVFRTKSGEPAPQDAFHGDIWEIDGFYRVLKDVDGEPYWIPLVQDQTLEARLYHIEEGDDFPTDAKVGDNCQVGIEWYELTADGWKNARDIPQVTQTNWGKNIVIDGNVLEIPEDTYMLDNGKWFKRVCGTWVPSSREEAFGEEDEITTDPDGTDNSDILDTPYPPSDPNNWNRN